MAYIEDGSGTVRAWLYGLGVIFGLTIIMILVLPIINTHAIPIIATQGLFGLPAEQVSYIQNQFSLIQTYIRISMYAILLGVIVYMFAAIFNKERSDYQY